MLYAMRAPRPERMKPPDSQKAMAMSHGICRGAPRGGAGGAGQVLGVVAGAAADATPCSLQQAGRQH